MNKTKHYIRTLLLMLLFIGGMANEAWAYTVTYHILTLPMSKTQPGNTNPDYYGYRWEALKVTDTNATTVGLPEKYKSPLAKNFTYYAAADVTKSGPYNDVYYNSNNKYYLYQISGSSLNDFTVDKNCDIYVTYEYDETNTIVKNDGETDYTIPYHIVIKDRILSFNIGRNNRLALIPKKYNGDYIVEGEQLCDENFSKIDLSDKNTGITTWWSGNKTPKEGAASHFHFRFRLKAKDPYNITICTDYEGDGVYYEKFGSDPNDMKKYYKWSTVFTGSKPIDDNLLIASDDHREYTSAYNVVGDPTYDEKPGYYRKNSVQVWNSFSLLNNDNKDGYLFIGTKCIGTDGTIQGGGTDNKFYYLKADNNTLTFNLMTSKDATNKYSVDKKLYELVKCNFHVKTPFGNTISEEKIWTEAYYDMPIKPKHVPAELRRKYCSIVGFYKDAALTQEITTFGDANDRTDLPEGKKGKDIYVKYEVTGAPFKAISPSASYTTATWYELTDANSGQSDGKKLKWNGSFKNNGPADVYERESEFAFVGDPYEMRVLYREATEANDGKRYVGAADPVSAGTALTFSDTDTGAGYKWEIPADDTDGSFELRQFGSTSMYWQWETGSADNNVTINTTKTRVKVMPLPNLNYTFNVVDLAGRIAIKATESLPPFTKLNGYNSIPESIRSPFLADETVTFYGSYEERDGVSGLDRRDWHNPSEQKTLTELPGTSGDIYVSYTTLKLSSKNIKLKFNESFNVKLNDEYIYWDSSTGKILSKDPASADLEDKAYMWHLRGRDPYAMRIDNMGASEGHTEPSITIDVYNTDGKGGSTTEPVNNGMFVRVKDGSWGDNKELTFINDRDQASRFVAMMSSNVGVYEVLAATGTTDQYHIGRASIPGAETKIYANSTFDHKSDQLRFELASKTLVTYHLIDRSGNELFKDEIVSYNPRLALPSNYVSPLTEYFYYKTEVEANAYRTAGTVGTRISEISDDPDGHIWVVYDAVTNVFGTSHPYMLKFHNGESYHLEDGADKLTTGDKIKAVYPYCNGDGNLNIYSEAMNEEQMAGGASTRPRWVWYLESATNDPYHVKIHSKSTISFNGGSHSTYLQTYAVHFDQETDLPSKQRIVTGANFPGISGQTATEYAILGVTGRYKLLTINTVAADLDGNGNTTDTGENERRYVTSFEQYWKTYNMVRQDVLGDARVNKNDPDAFNDPITMPAERWSELKTKLTAKGVNDEANRVDDCSWHSYEAIANATRWNGYSDKSGSDGYEKKKVERLQHWFQTFDMGDGTFDIESADIPSVLVLLDRHGWEIMRKPIPMGTGDAEAAAKLAALKVYDSPMVKEYKFYSQATKTSGCHKFTLRLQNGKERDTITVNNKHYKSTSLGTLPPYKKDQDLFVTYTVKEEYDKSYDPSTATASKFIVLQNHLYASDDGGTSSIVKTTAPSSLSSEIITDVDKAEGSKTFKQNTLWYVQPNPDIDSEMGYPGAAITYTDAENGFDPYNIQIKNVSTSKFFTIGMTKSILEEGQYHGDYTGSTTNVTLATAITGNSRVDSPESHDHSTLHMTNQTFMAVQDVNGNMQIMPRFDHNRRIDAFATLEDPKVRSPKAGVDDSNMGEQTTFMVRPVVHDYRIIDNQGNVAMRYRTGGEFYPSMPEHFKSPLAKDFEYYAGYELQDGKYKAVSSTREITSSFAAAGVTYDLNNKANIFIRYEYDESADIEHDNVLQGRWMTVSLGNQWVYYNGTLNTGSAGLYTNTKPATSPTNVLKDARQWHWKFLQNPMAETSTRYKAPDPYAVEIYNRDANKADADMTTAISVDGVNRYVILSHPDGDYALAKASDDINSYSFLNGNGMTAHAAGSPKSAKIVTDGDFSTSNNEISDDARVIFSDDITHTYVYRVITVAKKLAAYEEQSEAVAISSGYAPIIPVEIQTPLLNLEDYLYYGTAPESAGLYTIDTESQLRSLYGLYEDVVYVHYPTFDRDKTPYMVPNKRTIVASHVAVAGDSNPVAIDISGQLPYNIIWYNDNMMSSDGSTISDGGSKELNGDDENIWYFEGSDPYDIKIKKATNKYVDGTIVLNETAQSFMLLKKDDYEYGVLAETGAQNNMLSFDAGTFSIKSDPTPFIIFALSTRQLIYHLVIGNTGTEGPAYIDIPYREGTESSPSSTLGTEHVLCTTQRDLTSTVNGVAGDKYQLGHTYMGQTYCKDVGQVSIGDNLDVPTEFDRPNCVYFYYIDNIQTKALTPATYQKPVADVDAMTSDAASLPEGNYYYYNVESESAYYRAHKESTDAIIVKCTLDDYNNAWQDNATLNGLYKGLEVTKLMSATDLIGSVVRVNVTYAFDTGLDTNAGDGFVTSVDQNLWYTFETKDGPYLAQYTNAWGLQAKEGRDTRYTNDYLWTPLGDVYGFKMYNRYIYKTNNDDKRVVATESLGADVNLKMLEPVESSPDPEKNQTLKGNEVYELLADETTTLGYFLIHPVVNKDGTKYYVKKDATDGYTKLDIRANATEWTFGLTEDLIKPYYDRAGYVGGLTSAGKTAYEAATTLQAKQAVVYNDANIVKYAPGYYRLHSQPGVSGISPVRYASGYLHDTEKTAVSGGIPMHFYSRKSVSATFEGEDKLGSGFTKTIATQGDIPVPATEYDPSSIFYFSGFEAVAPAHPTSTMQTQGLYVARNAMGDSDNGTTTNRMQRAVMSATPEDALTLTLMDIGGAVLLIHDGTTPETRRYLNFDQSNTFQKTATSLNDAEDESSLDAQAKKFTSMGDYYFKVGDNYYKVSMETVYDSKTPETDATYTINSSTSDEWNKAADIYDLKYYHDSPTDDAKWCMEPANNQGMMVATNDGGEGYFYSTFCAPFDVKLPDDDGSNKYEAFVSIAWNTDIIHLRKVPANGTSAKGKFVPAGTPVVIRTTDNTGKIKLTLPTSTPTTPSLFCVFTGKYLEQLLTTEVTASDLVYTLGLPITGYTGVTYTSGSTNGEIEGIITGVKADKGVGFYINANHNKELENGTSAFWRQNNRYVIHNKIYYRPTEASSSRSAPKQNRAPEFIPVVFDDEKEQDEELKPDGTREVIGDGCVYDLMGRKVATREQVEDGSWKQRVATGIYIINGKKIRR